MRGDHVKTANRRDIESEMEILVRILGNEQGLIPDDVAHHLLECKISDRDKARMDDLAARNRNDELTPAEREEMIAFSKAATLLSILKSKARLGLGVKLDPRASR